LLRESGQFWPSICHYMGAAATALSYTHQDRLVSVFFFPRILGFLPDAILSLLSFQTNYKTKSTVRYPPWVILGASSDAHSFISDLDPKRI
jgi:hypothetical protein